MKINYILLIIISVICTCCKPTVSTDIKSDDADTIIHTDNDVINALTSDYKVTPYPVVSITYKFKNNKNDMDKVILDSNNAYISKADCINNFSTRLIAGQYSYSDILNNPKEYKDSIRSNIKYHLSKFNIELIDIKFQKNK